MSVRAQPRAVLTPRVLAIGGTRISNTADTNKNTLVTVVVPGNSLGPNGFLRIVSLWTVTANTNNKTFYVDFGGTTFSQLLNSTAGGNTAQGFVLIQNRNSASSQVAGQATNSGFGINVAGGVTTGSIDTTADQNLVFAAQCAVGTDAIHLDRYVVEVCYAP